MATFSKIKEARDFNRAYRRGKSYVAPSLVCYVTRRRDSEIRIGITTSKKIGNAVTRSRARRVITAAFRQVAPQMHGGFDIVFVARSLTARVKSTDLYRVMLAQLKEAGCL